MRGRMKGISMATMTSMMMMMSQYMGATFYPPVPMPPMPPSHVLHPPMPPLHGLHPPMPPLHGPSQATEDPESKDDS